MGQKRYEINDKQWAQIVFFNRLKDFRRVSPPVMTSLSLLSAPLFGLLLLVCCRQLVRNRLFRYTLEFSYEGKPFEEALKTLW